MTNRDGKEQARFGQWLVDRRLTSAAERMIRHRTKIIGLEHLSVAKDNRFFFKTVRMTSPYQSLKSATVFSPGQ